MSGKTHSFIGMVVAIILWIGYTMGTSGIVKLDVLAPIMIGAIVGSLIVDIDCKRSKASKIFTAVITVVIWIIIFLVLSYKYKIVDLSFINAFIGKIMIYCKNKKALVAFALLITLGKLSPHRQFTHKWFGTMLFSITAIICFNKFIAVGFIVGYISHILADKLTPAGVKFLDFKLPLVDRKGKISINI